MTTPITIQQSGPGEPIEVSVLSVGYRGPQGDLGPANTLEVGTVTTGEPGTEASAEITGDAPNQTLNLTIPRGDAGDAGPAGEAGPANTLTIGTVTTGAPGSEASAEITGDAPSQVLNLTLPGSSATRTINFQSEDYTLELSDAGCVVVVYDTEYGPRSITVPASTEVAFPEGTQIEILRLDGDAVSVQGGSGVTIYATPSLELRDGYSHATLLHLNTDYWVLCGDLADAGS